MSTPSPSPKLASSGLREQLLMQSGDVERNPGPQNKGESGEVGCGRANCKCSHVIKVAQNPGMAMDLPYLNLEGLTPEEEQAKRKFLIREYREVLFALQVLISDTIKGLHRNGHTPKSVADYMENVEAFYRSRNSDEEAVPLFKHLMGQIREMTSIEQVFVIIREHYSYFNHHVILEMKHSLGAHQSNRGRELTFTEKFNYYARHRVTECPQLYTLPSLKDYCSMIMLTNRDPTDMSMHEVESIRLRLGIQLKLARNTLRLIYVEKSGVKRMIFTFQFPSFLHPLVFPLTDEQKTAFVKDKIVYIDCCDYKFSIEELGTSTAEVTTTDKKATKVKDAATSSDVPMETAPPELTLPPCGESDFELSVEEKTITEAHLYLAQPGFNGKNYVAHVQQASDKALIASLIIREHVRKKRAGKALPKVIVVANSKPRAQELHCELETFLPKAQIHLFTGTEENSMTTKLCLQQTTVIVCTASKLHTEMESDVVRISSINLLIMDDSHLALQQTPNEAVIMHYTIKAKNYNSERPDYIQIVGLTDKLSGTFPALQVKPMVDHLVEICGAVDAADGICSVPDSLQSVSGSPHSSVPPTKISINTFKYQDSKHDFIALMSVEMGLLERDNELMCPFEKWSQEYKSFIKKKMKSLSAGDLMKEGDTPAESVSEEVSQNLGVLELLWLYSEALTACNERGCEEGLAILNRQEGNVLSNPAQVELRRDLDEVAQRKNAVLETLFQTVRHHLLENNSRDARGILFVDSSEEAQRFCSEIAANVFQAHPAVITRKTAVQYSTTSCINLTKKGEDPAISVDQKNVIQSFDNGETRLLIVPVAIETETDILNLPSCHFLLRLHHLENRYEMIDTEYVLTSAHSSELKTCSQLIKDIKQSIQKDALKQVPTGEEFTKAMSSRQDELMYEYTGRYRGFLFRRKPKKGPRIDMLQLRCKKCKVFVCHGTELFTFFVDGGQHYVVPKLDFRFRSTTQPYRSKHKTIKRVSRLRQIYCGNCCAKWGTLCLFPRKGCELPVLKSKNFLFEMDRKLYRIKMWSDALFYVPPISACDKFTVFGEESSKLED